MSQRNNKKFPASDTFSIKLKLFAQDMRESQICYHVKNRKYFKAHVDENSFSPKIRVENTCEVT
jgi:hypothetical protein